MAKFTKYNNPNKRKHRQTLSRADADIIAAKNMIDDRVMSSHYPIMINKAIRCADSLTEKYIDRRY